MQGSGLAPTQGTAQTPICCPELPSASAWSAAPQCITWMLVIFGWAVVHKTAAKRARRQEELATVNAIESRVAELRDQAIAYFTSNTVGTENEAWRLKHEVQSLISLVMTLRERKPKHYDLVGEAIAFRKALTGGMFENRLRSAVGHGDPVVLTIWLASASLVDQLKSEFEKANPDSMLS